jgi:hypothetical protein
MLWRLFRLFLHVMSHYTISGLGPICRNIRKIHQISVPSAKLTGMHQTRARDRKYATCTMDASSGRGRFSRTADWKPLGQSISCFAQLNKFTRPYDSKNFMAIIPEVLSSYNGEIAAFVFSVFDFLISSTGGTGNDSNDSILPKEGFAFLDSNDNKFHTKI